MTTSAHRSIGPFGAGLLVGLLLALAYARMGPDPYIAIRASKDSLQSAIESVTLAQTDRAARDSVEIQRLTGALAAARPRVVTARAATDTVLVAVPDTVRVLVAAERAAADTVIVRADSVIAALTAQVAYWRDTALVETRGQLAQSQALLDAALRVRRPSRFLRGVAVGAGIVAVLAAAR